MRAKVLLAAIFSAFLLPTASAQVQSSFNVAYEKTIQVPIAGATAAYALDVSIVEVSAVNGTVQITAKRPGSTNVIVVTTAGIQTLAVTVPAPPPHFPPGIEPLQREGVAAENGFYEVRYNSDPTQVTNSLMLKRTEGDSFERLQLVNANLISANSVASGESRVGFPLASYEISHPLRDVVFLDQTVDNSPLTVDRYMVRGLHVREGPWQFHGGFTTIATFQGLFLVTDPEETIGVSRTFGRDGNRPVDINSNGGLQANLDRISSVTANVYYFKNPAKELQVASNGFMGSLDYKARYGNYATFLSEIGFSHGLAVALRGNYDGKRTHLAGNFRLEPKRFASLAISNQHGTFADVNVTRDFSSRMFGSFGLTQTNYNLPQLQQNTFNNNALLNYRLTRQWTISGGEAYSRFASILPAAATITTLNLPVGIDYSTSHFGAGFQYQRTTSFDGTGGNDYGDNVRATFGQFQLNGFFRHDVQVPTLAFVFSQIPGLQDALLRAGLVVTTPDQLAQLLQDTALLATLGFTAPIAVNLAPSRNDSGAGFSWTSRGESRRQIGVNYFNSDTQLVNGSSQITTAGVTYLQRLGNNNDISASASVFRTVTGGSSTVHPLISVALQHRFFSAPSFILPGRHGIIEGHVFRDDESLGRYDKQPALAGVEIRLDDNRATRTDSAGRYSFHHVPYGLHRVEAKFKSGEPFFYTTDSPASAEMNAKVDFGINFAKGQVFGFILNDAGTGVRGVTVELHGSGAQAGNPPRTVQTGDDGKFSFLGLDAGTYSISTRSESYPDGYSLQNLQTAQTTVTPGNPAKVEISVKAIRSVAGRVSVYDAAQAKTVSLPGATVRLKELSQETKTNETGAFLFRNLPAGTFTIVVSHQGKDITTAVVVPPGPANIRDININAGAK